LTKGAGIASVAIAAMAGVCAGARAASADGGVVCPAGDAQWLRIVFVGEGFSSPLRARILEQLGAELRRHELVVCDPAISDRGRGAGPPLAEIGLALSPDFVLSVNVRDAVTDKNLARDLPLGSVPRDALALSITLATEELLHASWIEAALAPPASANASAAPAPATPSRPVPPAVRAMNAEAIARMPQAASSGPAPRAMTAQAALLGAIERSTGGGAASGQTDLGGDLRLSYGGRLAITARVGVRAAPDVTSAHGTVQGRELLAGVGVAYALVPREARWGGEIGARADALDVQFTGIAAAGAQAASGSALGALVTGALGGWGRLGGPWRVVAEAALGAPVHAVTATDVGATATGVAGVSIGGALGVAATLF